MRTLADRIRHTIMFEGIALLIVSPTIAFILGKSLATTMGVTIILSLIAMVWNGVYNWLFDITLLKLKMPLYPRPPLLRLLHAIIFEVVLFFTTLPIIVYFLRISYLHATFTNIGVSLFFLAYAYIYNWCYDLLFPVKERTAT